MCYKIIIQAPIYFGRVIDSACIVWDGATVDCTGDNSKGACAVYSPDKFRFLYFGLGIDVNCERFLLRTIVKIIFFCYCRMSINTQCQYMDS